VSSLASHVIDNLRLRTRTPRRAKRAEIDADLDEVLAIFRCCATWANKLGWTLSGGEQQMLAIARGLHGEAATAAAREPSSALRR